MSKGKIINFEGLDYSFKETNTKKLYEYIKQFITPKVKLIAFPNYNSESSLYVKRYLNGDYGDINTVNAYQASIMYALDRYDTLKQCNIEKLLDEGYYIIFDRYVHSNIFFQLAKIDKEKKDEIEYALEWIKDLEYNKLKLPLEDILIYMNMPVSVSHNLIFDRDNKNGSDIDIHEINYKFKSEVEDRVHLSLKSNKTSKYEIIDCVDSENNIKSEEDIFNDIIEVLKNNKIF